MFENNLIDIKRNYIASDPTAEAAVEFADSNILSSIKFECISKDIGLWKVRIRYKNKKIILKVSKRKKPTLIEVLEKLIESANKSYYYDYTAWCLLNKLTPCRKSRERFIKERKIAEQLLYLFGDDLEPLMTEIESVSKGYQAIR